MSDNPALPPGKVAIPTFGRAEFYGVESMPELVIVRLFVGDGEIAEFAASPTELRELGLRFYVHAKQAMGEVVEAEPPETVQ